LKEAGNMPQIKFKIMQHQSFKSADDLIQGIQIILSNYRCSFSEEERVLLNDCINRLEQLKSEPDLKSRMQATVNVVSTVIRIFSIIDHLKDLF
jgi:hypothetical protein